MGGFVFFVLVTLILPKLHGATTLDDFIVSEQCSAGNFPSDLGKEEVDRSKAYLFYGHAVTCEGRIDTWEFYAVTPGTFNMCVFRPLVNDQVDLLGCNQITAEDTGVQFVDVEESDRLNVQFTDIIGIMWDNPDDPQVVSIKTTPVPGKTFTQSFEVSSLTQPQLNNEWKYHLHDAQTHPLWTVAVRASIIGVSNFLSLARDTDNMSDEDLGVHRENSWLLVCDRWEESEATFDAVLGVMAKYVDWGEKEEEFLTNDLKQIQDFCKEHKENGSNHSNSIPSSE